eukprot:8186583-Pyramimonas_sp.AAC.1
MFAYAHIRIRMKQILYTRSLPRSCALGSRGPFEEWWVWVSALPRERDWHPRLTVPEGSQAGPRQPVDVDVPWPHDEAG